MKRFAILCVIGLTLLATGCSKDDDGQSLGYSKDESEALQVLNGSFIYDSGLNTTSIVFSPFPEPVKKKSSMNDVEMEFHGGMKYRDNYYDNDFYFYLDTGKKRIVAYSQHSEKSDYFNALVGKIWEYSLSDATWRARSLVPTRMKNYHMFQLDGIIYILGQDVWSKNKFFIYNPIWDN